MNRLVYFLKTSRLLLILSILKLEKIFSDFSFFLDGLVISFKNGDVFVVFWD